MSAAAADARPLPQPASVAAWKPKRNPWVIAITVTLATFMEVLDTSIANVALPHIAGGLGASEDEATWVLTSYLVANAVILPASAYLTTFLGRKRFYMICVVLFGISSALCGLAPSLGLLIFFRVLQGAGGGGLAPSEQAILADTFPPEKRGQAFALYGLAVVVAPAIGPTLGGWITDNFDWRWIFFINMPVAILSLFLTSRIVEDPPHIVEEVKTSAEAGPEPRLLRLCACSRWGSDRSNSSSTRARKTTGSARALITTFIVLCVRLAGYADCVGNHADPAQASADPRPHAVQAAQLCRVVCADVRAGIRAVRDHGDDPAICADAARLHGRTGRPGDLAGRPDGDGDDADRRDSWLRASIRAG